MLKKLLILPAIGLGVLALVLLMRASKAPAAAPPGEVARDVRTLTIPALTVQPRAVGYGVVRPGRVWTAVPQISGRLTKLHPRLKEGNFVKAEEELLTIDKAEYELDVSVGEARLSGLNAQLEELGTRRTTLEASLAIERRSLELAQTQLERIRSLVGSASLPQADRDREERTVLTQSLRVTELQNTLRLLDPQRKVLAAQAAQETANIARSKLAVQRAVIRAPFNGRIGPVALEQTQVVQAGQALFTLDSIDTAEATAQAPLRGMRRVVTAGASEIPMRELPAERLERLGLRAIVRLQAGPDAFQWDAEVVRVRGIDAQTRTVGIDVSVSAPYGADAPLKRPPLARGMYVEVEVVGRDQPERTVVPRSALHGEFVYLVNADQRLERRAITVEYVQGSFAVVRAGVAVGETLVVSDLTPAAEGMLLNPVADDAALEALRADAAGKTPVR
jgi:RND family efflux transporter MFP subunit